MIPTRFIIFLTALVGLLLVSRPATAQTRENFTLNGLNAYLITPDSPAVGKPWIAFTPSLPGPGSAEAWMFAQYYAAGIAVAGIDSGDGFGSPTQRVAFTALYNEMVNNRDYADKVSFHTRSRGGLLGLNWSADNPDKVAAVGGIYPAHNLLSFPGASTAAGTYGVTVTELTTNIHLYNPIERLAPLAAAGVKLFALHGDNDGIVPMNQNSQITKTRYDALGGEMTLKVIVGGGHDLSSYWFEDQDLTDFMIDETLAATNTVGPPTLNLATSVTPADNDTNVTVSSNLVANFSEAIALTGSGTILLKNLSGGADIPVALPGNVTIAGRKLTINPPSNLVGGQEYAVEISSDAIEDLDDTPNPYAGLLATHSPNWSFTADGTAPGIDSRVPTPGATNVTPSSDLVLTFDEDVLATSGNITLHLASDHSVVQTIPANSGAVTITGGEVTVELAALTPNTSYYVNVASGAFTDPSGNIFAGVTGTTSWTFTTGAIPISGSLALINGNLETPGGSFPALNANITPAHGWINPGGNSWALTTTGPSSPQEAGGGANHGLIHGQAGGDTRQITSTPMVAGTTYTARMDIYHRDFSSLGNGVFRLLSDTVAGGGGTRTILNSATGISAPAVQGQWLLDVTVQYTATAADAGKFIGVAIGNVSGASNWIEFDNVRLDATSTGDSTPPTLTGKVPGNGGSGVAVDTNLVATFSEDVQKGTGNIVIKKYDDDMVVETIDVTTAAVGVSGKDVTINPPGDLADSTKFYVEIPLGAIKDLANNDFAGLSNKDDWNFTTTIPDLTAPAWTNLSPADGAVDVPVGTNLVITFDENVQQGSGNLVIKESGGSVFETIPFGVSDARISISGAAVTIDPTASMAPSTGYYVEIDNGAIKDLANNNFAGFTGSSTWNFTTAAVPIGGPIALINGNLETPGTNFPVLNANNNAAHGWYHSAETWAVTTTGPSSPQEAGGGSWHGLIHGQASGGAIRQVTPTVMIEGTTYTAMMDIYHRDFTSFGNGMISLISGTSSGSGGTITILNTTTGISAPVTQGQWLLDVTVQYTATAADAGKFIGIAIDNVSGTGNWIEFDNVRLTASAPPPANTFASWIGGFSLDPAHTGFGDDADGDNLANGVEAWFGTHPGQFNAGVRNLSSDGTNTTFDHPQNDDPPGDLTGYYEWSPNLSDWYPSGSGPVGGPTVSFAPNTVGTTTTVTATASDPLDQLFLRVGVMQE